MTPRQMLVSKVVCGLFIVLLASCDSTEVHRRPNPGPGPGIGHGPPAHAKAHGYRRKQVCGYDLVYDAGCGVYVVVGLPDCYYHDGHFYRLHGETWQVSLYADSGWGPLALESLPPGLRVKVKAGAQAKAKENVRLTAKGHAQARGKGNGRGKW